MGHTLIGVLPASRKWRQVVALIGGGADVSEVAAATSSAAESSMVEAAEDPTVRQSVWLLTQIPLAAASKDFGGELRRLGLPVSNSPTLVSICTALVQAIDEHVAKTGARTDAGEMAQISAAESLGAVAGREIPALFGTSNAAEDARLALKGLGTVSQFSVLARDFFSRLMRRYLDYYLSRELPQHVGGNGRFHTIVEHREFEEALDLHCREASGILRDFAGEWYSKTNYQGGIDPKKAGGFAHYSFSKLRDEMRARRDAHA